MNVEKKYTCLIIDDNEIDRLTSLALARKYPFLNILGIYSSASEALDFIQDNQIDVLLSDIDMPEMSGLEFRSKVKNIPICVFITAFPEYAADSFDVDAFDFLLKPIKFERFDHCMNRILSYFELKRKAELFEYSLGANTIFIKEGHQQIKLNLHEVIYLEALKDYTKIITSTKKYSVLTSIGNLLLENSFNSFLRIHRSFAVQPNYIDRILTQSIDIQGFNLPIGRSYKDVLTNLK